MKLYRGQSQPFELFTEDRQEQYTNLLHKYLKEELSRNELMQLQYLMKLKRCYFTNSKTEAKQYADPHLITIDVPEQDLHLFSAEFQHFHDGKKRYLVFCIDGLTLAQNLQKWSTI